jgi:hypothetical protein
MTQPGGRTAAPIGLLWGDQSMFMSTSATFHDRLRDVSRTRGPTPRGLALACGVFLAVILARVPAQAEGRPYQVTVGGKLGVGGNFLGAPSDPPAGTLPFDDGVGGWGLGGGVFGEARFFKGHLGAEIGLLFDSSHNWSKLTVGNAIDYRLGWKATDLRLPILVNAGTSNEGTRLAFGTGPEFVFPLGTTAVSEVDSGPAVAPLPLNAEGKTHVNWVFNAGLAAPIGSVKLTFDIRFALNLQNLDQYADRYDFFSSTVVAMHRMDLRLLFGVAYDVLK